jgi:sec-independent protein translocase protein TatB
MFDIGWGELLVIGIVALVVIGPKELPAVVRTLGQSMTKLRRMAAEFQSQFNEAMREAELDELKKQAEKLVDSTTTAAYEPFKELTQELDALPASVDAAATVKAADASADAPAAAEPPPPAPAPAAPPEPATPEASEPADKTDRAASGGGRGA